MRGKKRRKGGGRDVAGLWGEEEGKEFEALKEPSGEKKRELWGEFFFLLFSGIRPGETWRLNSRLQVKGYQVRLLVIDRGVFKEEKKA